MPVSNNIGDNKPQFKNHFEITTIEKNFSFSRASKHTIYPNNNFINSRYCFCWQKAFDRKDIRTATKNKIPQRKNWPDLYEKLRAEELLSRYGEWGTRTGKRVGNKWYVRIGLDLLELPLAIKNTLDKGFDLLINRQKIMFIKTKKGYHVILLLDELPPNGIIYHIDKFGVKRKVGDILSAGRQAQELGSPDKEPAGQGKWTWQAKNIEVIVEIFKKYFFLIECKEKVISNINADESPKTSKITNKNAYKIVKLAGIKLTSKQITKKLNHYKVNYCDRQQRRGFFFLDSYFRDKKELIQPNLVVNLILSQGHKYQFFVREF